jgi:hypothetical protein
MSEIDDFVADLARREESLSVAKVVERVGRRFGGKADKERIRGLVRAARVGQARRRSLVLGSVAALFGLAFLAGAIAILRPLWTGEMPGRGIKIPAVLALFGFGLLGTGLKLLLTGRAPDAPLGRGD